MLELTEKEKKLLGKYYGSFVEDPLEGIAEGLVASYYSTKEEKERKEAAYEYTKRLLMAVAEKRGLTIDNEETFEIEDMIINDELKDFDLEYYKDYNLLKQYVDEKAKTMNAEETEELYHIFGGQLASIQGKFTAFMANYIPEIIDNIYKLNEELEEDEETQEYPTEEDWVADANEEGQYDEAEITILDETDWEDSDVEWEIESENKDTVTEKKELSNEKLVECIKFLNSYSKLMIYKGNNDKLCDEYREIVKQKKLDEFYNNKEFFEDFKKIMEHDKHKHNYLFHGTQDLESAESIMNEGLGMMRENLSSTTYSEFTMDDVILYSRGFGGEIGREAIVIIDQPINEDGKKGNIVHEKDKTKKINFVPSGLQGYGKAEYIVDSKYIIGYVNKRDKQVIYNPKYYDYNKFKNEKRNEFIESLKVNIEKTNQGKEDKKPEIVSQEEKSIEDDL